MKASTFFALAFGALLGALVVFAGDKYFDDGREVQIGTIPLAEAPIAITQLRDPDAILVFVCKDGEANVVGTCALVTPKTFGYAQRADMDQPTLEAMTIASLLSSGYDVARVVNADGVPIRTFVVSDRV